MTEFSTPARFIRKRIFCVRTQSQFAELLGYTQETISKFETGSERLSAEAQERIRNLAQAKKIAWDNNWFFEIPKQCGAGSTGAR